MGTFEQTKSAETSSGDRAHGARAETNKRPVDHRYAFQPQAAAGALDAAARILHDGDTAAIRPPLQTKDIVALWELHAASTQRERGRPIASSAALALLDHATPTLMEACDSYLDDDNEDDRVWVQERVLEPLRALRDRLTFLVASDRVDQAVLVGGRVFDVGDGAPLSEREGALRAAIGKLVPTLGKLNELVGLAHEPEIEEELERQLEAHLPRGGKYGSMLDLANALNVADGLMTLTDDELRERLKTMHGPWETVGTVAELVKAVTEFVGGCVGVSLGMTGVFAKLVGETEIAQVAIGAGRFVASHVGTVLVVAEFAAEFAAAISAKTTEEKVGHGLNAAAGAGLMAAKYFGKVGFGASTVALQLSYGEAQIAATMYWEGAQGIVQALMTPAFEKLRYDANAIAGSVERVIKARALVDAEHDQDRRASFERVLAQRAAECGESIDGLISDIAAPDLAADMATYPGAYKILADALAPVRSYRHSRTPEAVMSAASIALSKLTWIFANASEIRFAATTHGNVEDVERLAEKRAKRRKEDSE